jgi:putative MATE family efflux protein
MDKKFGTDLTVGSIPRHLLKFSIPMLTGNLIQVAYSIINTIWVGNLVGENAVGAIGVSFPVLLLLVGLAFGISMATTIVISQYYGAKNLDMVKKAVNNSFALGLIVSITLAIAGMLSSDLILKLIDTPVENFNMASGYLKICMINYVPIYLVILISSILRGIGDTVTPLLFMAIGVGINAVLDPFFIGGFGPFPNHGLIGAAYASLIAQTITLIISMIYLDRKDHIIAFNLKKLTLDRHMTSLIFKIGFPSIIQQSLVSISAMFVITFVNAFGNAATNAFGAVQRIDMVAFIPAMSMSMAAATLTGQNLGAGKPQRIKEVFKWGIIMSSTITIFISLIVVIFSKAIFVMFGIADDAEVLGIGINYMHIVGSCYTFFAVMFISNGIINGAGHTMITMFFTVVSLWLVRVPVSWMLSKTSLGITGIWIAISISFAVTMTVSLIYYFSGRWNKSAIIKPSMEAPIME